MTTKPRHILRKEWSDLRADIERVRKDLKLSEEDFSEVNINEWQSVQQNIKINFLHERSHNLSVTWLWNDFKAETFVFACESDPYKKLDLLIDEDEVVWFFVNETVNEKTKYWFYQGRIKAIQEVIGEAVGLDEYYIASKKYKWMLCVNHHDILIGAGDIIPKLKEKEKEINC